MTPRYLVVWRPDLSPPPQRSELLVRLLVPLLARTSSLDDAMTVSLHGRLVGDLHDGETGKFFGRLSSGLMTEGMP